MKPNRAVCLLFAGILERAIRDAQGYLFYVDEPRRRAVQQEAHDWLFTDEATLLALSIGISANRFRMMLTSLPEVTNA